MSVYLEKKKHSFIYRVFSACLLCIFSVTMIVPPSYAQGLPAMMGLPSPTAMIGTTPLYVPALIKGIEIHPDNPLQFGFIIDSGHSKVSGRALEKEATRMVKYFLAALTIPEKELWVNLSPYEKDRIIPDAFSQTDMGMDLLAQDYILKQLTASLMYPEKELGAEFWRKVHKQVKERFGKADFDFNTFNKIWIVPEKAVVFERDNQVFVVNSHLKVLMEEDYIALQNSQSQSREAEEPQSDARALENQIIREVIVPAIEEEVNYGKHFARLRQINNAAILAKWYKQSLKESLLGQVYVDQAKMKGIDTSTPQMKEEIYQQYIEAFKKGVYNYIKEDTDPQTQEIIPRRYFSGGAGLAQKIKSVDSSMLNDPQIKGVVAKGVKPQGSVGRFDFALLENKADASQLADDGQSDQSMAAERYLAKVENPYLTDSRKRIEGLASFLSQTDPHFVDTVMEPESIFGGWVQEERETADGQTYSVDIYHARARNNSAGGPTKGGLRHFDSKIISEDDGVAVTAHDLMKDEAFEKAFENLNKANPSKEQVMRFIKKWIDDEVTALSLWMTFKVALFDLPLGGGKGAVFVGALDQKEDGTWTINDPHDPKKITKESKALASLVQGRALAEAGEVGPYKDIPAPDRGTGEEHMAWYTEALLRADMENGNIRRDNPELYERLKLILDQEVEKGRDILKTSLLKEAFAYMKETGVPVPRIGTYTAKPVELGGAIGRTSGTGSGVVTTIIGVLDHYGETVENKTLTIQGAGNVGIYAAERAIREGMILKAIGDEGVTLVKKDGQQFTLEEIQNFIAMGKQYTDAGKRAPSFYEVWQDIVDTDTVDVISINDGITSDMTEKEQKRQREVNAEKMSAAILEAKVDVVSPCATEGVLRKGNAGRVNARFLVPGANGPITSEAEEILIRNGVVVVPDTLANGRGVTVSYIEFYQALVGRIFTEQEVFEWGERLHLAAIKRTLEQMKQGETMIPMRLAADVAAARIVIRAQYLRLIKEHKGNLEAISEARGFGESEEQLLKQIENSGLGPQLRSAQKPNMEIVKGIKKEEVLNAVGSADVIIGTAMAEDEAPIIIDEENLRTISHQGTKAMIDVAIDQGSPEIGGNFSPGYREGMTHEVLSSQHPAYLDQYGNLRFMVPNMASIFDGVASDLLSRASQPVSLELVSGKAVKEILRSHPGIRQGIIIVNGRLTESHIANLHEFGMTEGLATERELSAAFNTVRQEKVVGVVKEITDGETRVAIVPREVKELTEKGATVLVEEGAGLKSGILDEEYVKAGAQIVSAEEVWEKANVIRKVKAPLPQEFSYFREGLVLEAYFSTKSPAGNMKDVIQALMDSKMTVLSYEEVDSDGSRPLMEPTSRVAGWISALWGALYRRSQGTYGNDVDETSHVKESRINDVNVKFGILYDYIKDHFEELRSARFSFPPEILERVGLWDNAPKHVVVFGGGYAGREAAYMSLVLGAKKVTIVDPNLATREGLDEHFRKVGFSVGSSTDQSMLLAEENREAVEKVLRDKEIDHLPTIEAVLKNLDERLTTGEINDQKSLIDFFKWYLGNWNDPDWAEGIALAVEPLLYGHSEELATATSIASVDRSMLDQEIDETELENDGDEWEDVLVTDSMMGEIFSVVNAVLFGESPMVSEEDRAIIQFEIDERDYGKAAEQIFNHFEKGTSFEEAVFAVQGVYPKRDQMDIEIALSGISDAIGAPEDSDVDDSMLDKNVVEQRAASVETTPVGGIDLNPELYDLQIKRDGNGVPLPLPQQPIETMHIEGFFPILINVTPIPDLPMLIGFTDEDVDGTQDSQHTAFKRGVDYFYREEYFSGRKEEDLCAV